MNPPSIYLINLDRDNERLTWSMGQLDSLQLVINRVSAVDMFELPKPNGSLVTSGVMACWESHKKALRQFLNSNLEYAILVEDDIQIRSLKRFLKALELLHTSSWDVVQLGFLSPGYMVKIRIVLTNFESLLFKIASSLVSLVKPSAKVLGRMRIKSALHTPWGWVNASFEPGTHCYLISRTAAEIVLELNNPQFLSADDFYMALSKMRSLRFLRPNRSLACQHNFPKFPGPRFTVEQH